MFDPAVFCEGEVPGFFWNQAEELSFSVYLLMVGTCVGEGLRLVVLPELDCSGSLGAYKICIV
jgi:hypothetical protein